MVYGLFLDLVLAHCDLRHYEHRRQRHRGADAGRLGQQREARAAPRGKSQEVRVGEAPADFHHVRRRRQRQARPRRVHGGREEPRDPIPDAAVGPAIVGRCEAVRCHRRGRLPHPDLQRVHRGLHEAERAGAEQGAARDPGARRRARGEDGQDGGVPRRQRADDVRARRGHGPHVEALRLRPCQLPPQDRPFHWRLAADAALAAQAPGLRAAAPLHRQPAGAAALPRPPTLMRPPARRPPANARGVVACSHEQDGRGRATFFRRPS
mmetsp:Transcript_50460/g.146709  ORF Transcript_50460/g.146709 Transcript_50460/m.146709 type:complete len:266 (-) Transcript_50460:52-849(-)